MEEKINKSTKKHSKDKINQKTKKNAQCEPKKKFISHNPLSSSKNNDSTNDTLKLKNYNKPFKKNNTKSKEKKDIYGKDSDNKNKGTSNNNKQNKYNQMKDDTKQNNKINKFINNNVKTPACGNLCVNRYMMKEDEEIVTSFERKPSEIQSPNTVSEDSFITDVSNFSNKKTIKKNNYNDNEDIVNYNKNNNCYDRNNDHSKGKNKQSKTKKLAEEKDVFNKSKEFNKNESTEKSIIYNSKMQSCKKILPDKYYMDKMNLKKSEFNEKKNIRKEIYNKNLENSELKNNTMFLINEYNLKKNELKKEKFQHMYNDNDMNINTKKFDYDYDNTNYLNSTINKNTTRVQFDLDLDKRNSGLNNSNIYIPVNQRKKLESNKKNKFNDNSVDSTKDNDKKNSKKNYLFNSTDLNHNNKKLSILIKNKNDKSNKKNVNNQKISKKESNKDSLDIIPKNILNDLDDNEKKENNEKMYNKNTNINANNNANARNYVNKNSTNSTSLTKNVTFIDRKADKLSLTNVNFYKNKNSKNNANKKNNKLFLSIDDLNEIQKPSVLNTKVSEKNPIVYAPKKPSMVKYKSKKKKDFLYNRASYDPNQSNYNNIRKKNFTKEQTITTVNLINNNGNKRHTRNYSGINNTTLMDIKNQEFIPNQFSNINNYIFNNNSHSIGRNSINMKIINSLNRSYDSNFYPNLNKLYFNQNRNNLMLNKNLINNNLNVINTKTPNKYSLKTSNFFNENVKENDKKKFNIYANNINNINNYLDIENPIVKYNIHTNKNYNNNQNNNINIIDTSNNNKNNLVKERLTFMPPQKRINFDLGNQCNRYNNLNIQNYQNQSNLINLYNNNNLFEEKNLTNTVSCNSGNNYNLDFNLNLFNYWNNQQRVKPLSFNIEDLILLLEKFNNIIVNFNKINSKRIVYEECSDFWNYYFNCSVYCQLEKLFLNNLDSNAIRISINYCLMSLIILYDYSFEIKCLKNDFNSINNILKLNYMNLMLISDHILKMITSSKSAINNNNSNIYNNFLILKLFNIIDIFKKKGGFQNDFIEMKPFLDLDMSNVEKISYNTNLIIQYLRYALKNNKTSRNEILTSFFKKIKEKTYEEINIFFRENVFRIINKKGSAYSSAFMNDKQFNNMNNNILKKCSFRSIPAPYLRTKNNKNYSLILDLDETLIHFKPGNNDEEGVVRIRPGVTEFLEEIGQYYELIVFTTGTQDYADLLIDAVEEDKIYFDHRLYREHATTIDNEIVKDLRNIGRPLDKIIIIDDNPQCFKLQKENGIAIKPFLGEDNYDKVLFGLIPILKNIAKEGGDIRNGLIKYKNKILNIASVHNN